MFSHQTCARAGEAGILGAMNFSTLLIDLDETVYSPNCGIWEAISQRMEQFMFEELHLTREEIPGLRKQLYQQYGTTLRGLQVTRQVDERAFIDFVHDVPMDQLLLPDQELGEMLRRYSQRKIIFTNADRNHAGRVLQRLQIADCFSGIIDIYDIAPYCKPMPEAYQAALRLAGETRAEQCVFIDDSPRNLAAARALGFFTVQVGAPKPGFQHPEAAAHVRISRLIDLPTVLNLDLES